MIKQFAVNLEVTNVCNFDCNFCPQQLIKRPRGFMKVSLAKKALKEIKDLDIAENILFHLMGEPLLHPQLEKIARYGKKFGFNTELFTNGWLLAQKEDVLKNIDRIELSVNLLSKEEFKEIRPGIRFRDYIHRIRKGLAICAKYPLKVDFAVMVNPLQRILSLNKNLNVIPAKREMESVRRILKERLEIPSSLNFGVIIKILEPWGEATFNTKKFYPAILGACLGLQDHFGILWDGIVTVCCKDYDGLNGIGNINDSSLNSILYSSSVKARARAPY